MTLNEISKLLDRIDRRSDALSILERSPKIDAHLRRYWVNLWDSSAWGMFTVRERDYHAAKAKINPGRNLGDLTSEVEKVGEEGSTNFCKPAIAVLLPQQTWDGFKAANPQKTGTVVHELTHVEDYLVNGDPSAQRIALTVWSEFFAETVAGLFYDTRQRLDDLQLGMECLSSGEAGVHSGLAQLGRFLGFLNGCGCDSDAVSRLFSAYGPYWHDAAVAIYPIVRECLVGDKQPQIAVLEEALSPLFGTTSDGA